MGAKIIFHIDLNAFYCTVASIKDPFLKGKAFGIGNIYAGADRGILSTASYEARKYGIKAAMNIHEAKRRYPKFTVVKPDFESYFYYSDLFFNYLKTYSHIILKGSIDEAYIDMTDYVKDKNTLEVAKKIQDDLLNQYELPVSIGIAPTIFLAKMASDLKKPLGITVLRIKDIKKKLFVLPIKDLFGIGAKTYPKLEALGIKTIGDFAKTENESHILTLMSADHYHDILKSILGASSNQINPSKYEIPQSISNEETLTFAIFDEEEVVQLLTSILQKVVRRLKNEHLVCKTIFIKYKYEDMKVETKSFSLKEFTDEYHILYDTMMFVYESKPILKPVRLLGVGVSKVKLKTIHDDDFHLFNYHTYEEKENQIRDAYQSLPEKLRDKVSIGKLKNKPKKGMKDK